MKINCLSIDHDSHGLEKLAECIASLSDHHSFETFTNPNDAFKKMLQLDAIDLLIINFESFSSVDLLLLLQMRPKIKKLVISSQEVKHAIDAYDIDAEAFLLKPYTKSKVLPTLNKLLIKDTIAKQETKKEEEYFFIKSKNEKFNLIKIRPSEIIYIESLQNYIAIQTTTKKVIAHSTLTKIKEILKNQKHIIQVHRSFLISKRFIEEIESNIVKMDGNINIAVGGDYKNELLNYIKERTIKTGRNVA